MGYARSPPPIREVGLSQSPFLKSEGQNSPATVARLDHSSPPATASSRPVRASLLLNTPICQPPVLAALKCRVCRTASSAQPLKARITDQPRPMLLSLSFGPPLPPT